MIILITGFFIIGKEGVYSPFTPARKHEIEISGLRAHTKSKYHYGFKDIFKHEILSCYKPSKYPVFPEYKRIEKPEPGLHTGGYALNRCINEWSTRNQSLGGNKRLESRLAAIDQIFKGNYSALHEQLRSEVSEINSRVDQLEKNYGYDRYVKMLTPLVRACTAQAIKETCPLFAFQLTDFSYVVIDLLFQGMGVLYDTSCSVGKGVSKGISATLSIDHWKSMITDTAHLAAMCIDAIGQEALFDTSYAIARSSQEPDAIMKFAEQYYLQTNQEKEAFKASMQESYNKLAAMSWQEVIENGSEIGTTMILDGLVLNVAGGCAGSINKTFINKLSNLTESGVVFTEQYAVEVAGFGKLIIEEGPECATKIGDAVKNDLILCIDNQSAAQQARRIICPQKWAEEVAHKIRNVGDDILDIMEKAGGHTLEKHVGKTHQELLSRSRGVDKNTISTFANKRIAIDVVKENLKHNAEEISVWLSNNKGLDEKKVFHCSHKYTIGNGIMKGKKNGVCELFDSKIVLLPDAKFSCGFKILTAYPV
jgi:hypothetical protein